MSKLRTRESTPLSLIELVSTKVDLRRVLEGIDFDQTDLVKAAVEQPLLMREAGTLRTQAMYKRSRFEAKLEVMRGEISQKYRNIRDSKGKREHTEPAVKAWVETRPAIVELRKKIDRCYAEEEMAKNLLEVYRMRKESIQVIVQMGKISVQLKELAMVQQSNKLRRALKSLRGQWQQDTE